MRFKNLIKQKTRAIGYKKSIMVDGSRQHAIVAMGAPWGLTRASLEDHGRVVK